MIHHVELSERVQTLLSTYAKQTGQTEDDTIAEANQNHLENLADIRDAVNHPGKRWTLEKVERDL